MPNEKNPKYYNTNNGRLNGYRNMIYKMLRDKVKTRIIATYVISKGYSGTERHIIDIINKLRVKNFGTNYVAKNDRNHLEISIKKSNTKKVVEIKRNEILKYITTKNDRVKKDKNIEKYISLIKEKYPIINEIINVYNDFYNIFKEKKESLYDEFINKYELKENINPETGEILEIDDNIENVKSGIQGFIKSIKKDITPIKAAISFNESSGFVEGNNNKFKLIKRILYGRCNLVNLFKKCFSIFSLKASSNIFNLLNFFGSIPYQA